MVDSDPPHGPPSAFPETWTVKEVVADLKTDIVGHLNKQDLVLNDIRTAVDSKADKSDLVELAAEVRLHAQADAKGFEDHGQRIQTLEESRAFRTKAWIVVGSAAGTVAIIVGAVLAILFH